MTRDRRGRASRFNRLLEIETPSRVPNGAGGFTKGWASAGDAWAEMIPLRGAEALEHSIQRSTQLWKITVRWRENLDEQCRFVFDGKHINIRTCEDPDGLRTELVMTGESGVPT